MKGAIWFKHDSNARNDPRIIKLRMKYGMEGYGIYFAILEIMCEEENYKLEQDDIVSIAWEFRVDEKIVYDIIENYVLFVSEDEEFYSRSLLRRMNALNESKEKLSKAGRKGGLSKAKAELKDSLSDDKATLKHKIRVDKNRKRIDKIRKDNKETVFFPFDLFWNLYDYKQLKPDCEDIWTGKKKSKRGLLFDDEIREKIMNHLSLYVANTYKNGEYPPRKHPKTYLNNNCWEDEIVVNEVQEKLIFNKDACGFPMAYCETCGVSASYKEHELSGESRCCNAKLLPTKPNNVSSNGRNKNLVEQSKRYRKHMETENNTESGTPKIGQFLESTIEKLKPTSTDEEGDGQQDLHRN